MYVRMYVLLNTAGSMPLDFFFFPGRLCCALRLPLPSPHAEIGSVKEESEPDRGIVPMQGPIEQGPMSKDPWKR